MRVAVVTTVAPERCGNRTYGEEIARRCVGAEISLIGRPFDGGTILARTAGHDVVHILLGGGLVGELNATHIQAMKARGQKTVFTLHEYPWNLYSDFVGSFDKVLIHQREAVSFGWGWRPNCEYMPHGIPIKEDLKPYSGEMSDYIGTFGFPVDFKQYPLAAQLAQAVGKKIFAIIPGGSYGDAVGTSSAILRYCPGSIIDTSFPTHDEALEKLAQCCFMLFPYLHTAAGIGGSARAGVGARRPVVISQVVRFQDWLDDYRDEFYVIPDYYPSFATSLPVVQQVVADIAAGITKVPVRAFEDQNWITVGRRHVDVYRNIMEH